MPKFLKFLFFLLLVVLASFAISYFLPTSNSKEQNTQQESELVSETEVPTLGTIVIDAGHGGRQ